MLEYIKSIAELIGEAEKIYKEVFGCEGPYVRSWGPGRVNLVGEHTDYCDGFVLPAALPIGTVIIGQKNNLNKCRVYTMAQEMFSDSMVHFEISKDDIIPKSSLPWANYVIGVISYFPYGKDECFDAVINSSVPLGSGLSSSASLEVAVYTFLEGIYGINDKVSLTEKALICQKAEHNYANVPCGIMDQFISFMGKADHALCIDCRDLSYNLVKIDDDQVDILIVNSNVKHTLGESEYPLRRNHCHSVAKLLGKKALRDVSLSDLENMSDKLDPVAIMRARHVISENQRVLDFIHAMKKSDFSKLGELMNASHKSLRYDFEVSCNEIDQLVEITQSLKGVFGSRMTGGGFGGCTVSLVKHSEINNILDNIKKHYTGKPLFYICKASNGAQLF